MAEYKINPPIEPTVTLTLTRGELINLRGAIYGNDLEGEIDGEVWRVINLAFGSI